MTDTGDRPASFRAVFAIGEFRGLLAAHVLSVAGDQLARLALTILVWQQTSSPSLTALTFAVSYVPDVLGGLVLAAVADRFSRRTVMVATDLARAVVVAAMALPGVPLVVRVGLLVVVQLAAVPFTAARQAVLPELLDGDRLVAGTGILSMTYQCGLAFGFGGGAAVVDALSPAGALWVDAGTFLISAALLRATLRPHRPAGSAAPKAGRWPTITAGWRLVAADKRLLALLGIACCSGFYVVPEGLAVPYAAELGANSQLGWLLAANPLGTIAGVVVLKRLAPSRRLALLGPLAAASSLVLLPTGWAPSVLVSALLWGLSGAFSAHDMVTQATYVRLAPDARRGQALGVAGAAFRAAQGLAIVLSGLLAQAIAPSLVIAVFAAAGVLGAMAAATGWARASVAAQPDAA
ncbi:Predicted arabinose efflux permease, MFS family [Amycolatopsis xylanica]|uniref:Predicted arabinose efflux permease, MFS family n=1 Tax=Amycolatopsis xylanica TaxID=589385 RepID=A0A1H2VGJ9_9PSEU|nr:MFS transporter [Amycolatopsis xylanica]SDW67451.1 Predicted arabinose efflux permease, MFS family [Amycolatopsis xylanica]